MVCPAPHFDLPFLSTSLREFWGRRWNLYAGGLLKQSVFEPVMQADALLHNRRLRQPPPIHTRPTPRAAAFGSVFGFGFGSGVSFPNGLPFVWEGPHSGCFPGGSNAAHILKY